MVIQEIPICPKCGSDEVSTDGAMIEAAYSAKVCQDCGYQDTTFPMRVSIERRASKKRINKK